MRIDPPPSVATPAPTMPAATAAPDPPLEPPGVREVSHGLREMPHASDSVAGQIASSGMCVRPITIAPASRRRLTILASAAAGPS
jgi:hypothetical protein